MIDLTGKKISGDGDSIMLGALVTPSTRWLKLVCDHFGSTEVNRAINGQGLVSGSGGVFSMSIVPNYASDIALQIFALSVNDIINNSDFNTYKSTLASTIDAYKAKGYPADRIIILSPTYISGYGSTPQLLQNYTTAIQTKATEKSVKFIDVYNPLKNDPNLASYYPDDTLHPVEAGNTAIANIVISGINSLYASQLPLIIKRRRIIV